MPARIHLHIKDGEIKLDVNGTVTRDVAVQIARLFWQGAKDHLDRKAKETLDPSVWGSLDAPGGGQ